MSGSQLVAEVPEGEATGRVAEIYPDIRETTGLALVNLIWRHLATRPGALEWAWTIAKPVYASGAAEQAATRLAAGAALPSLEAVPATVTRTAGLEDPDRAVVRRILDSYNRGNGLNLIALSSVLEAENDSSGNSHPSASDVTSSAAAGELPPIPALDSLPTDVREVVLALNAMGTAGADAPIVATLYRHLAHWPGYLALMWSQLAPLEATGTLDRAIADIRTAAAREAARAAPLRGSAPAEIGPDDRDFARAAIASFAETTISRMVAIGLMLSRSLD